MKEIIEKAKKWALEEIKLYGTPKIEHFELSNQKGQELAKKLNADADLVMLGTILMDVKLGECFKEGKLEEHTPRSAKATVGFLKQFDLDEEIKKKIINCVEAHHHTKDYICLEAEICANADCYRFLHPRGIFGALVLWGERDQNLNNVLKQVEKKFEEKQKILSLDICKKELAQDIEKIKELLRKAK